MASACFFVARETSQRSSAHRVRQEGKGGDNLLGGRGEVSLFRSEHIRNLVRSQLGTRGQDPKVGVRRGFSMGIEVAPQDGDSLPTWKGAVFSDVPKAE